MSVTRTAFCTAVVMAMAAGAVTVLGSIQQPPAARPAPAERHLRNIRQLTFGGENAEAYFSPDGTHLIFQSTREGSPCDQIFTMKVDGTDVKRVSTGQGRTTCILPSQKAAMRFWRWKRRGTICIGGPANHIRCFYHSIGCGTGARISTMRPPNASCC